MIKSISNYKNKFSPTEKVLPLLSTELISLHQSNIMKKDESTKTELDFKFYTQSELAAKHQGAKRALVLPSVIKTSFDGSPSVQ